MSELPDGWLADTLGNLSEKITKGTTPTTMGYDFQTKGIPFIKIENISENGINTISKVNYISNEAHQALFRSQLVEGDILFTIAGTIGKTALVSKNHLPANTNQAVAIIRGTQNTFQSRFLLYQLKWRAVEIKKTNARGGAMNNVSLGDISNSFVMIPPLSEQKRIADKLDTLLARLDTTRERLDRIPTTLKQFRQAVLAAATSGALTEGWREENDLSDAQELLIKAELFRDKAKIRLRSTPQKKPAIADLPFEVDLPINWVVTCFDELAEADKNALKAGPFGSALKKDMYVPSGYKIYGQEQVISGDETVGNYYISSEKYLSLESCSVKPGDILISLVGTIGKVLVLSPTSEKGIINPRLVKLSLYKEISSKYITFYLQSEHAQMFFRKKSHGGTMDVLNLGLLRELPILLPSVLEQEEIVRRVEKLFAFADNIEARYQTARAQLDKLTPALLAKAFRGELVEQDPNDEPAEKLLERLRAKQKTDIPAIKSTMKKTAKRK